MRKLLSISLLVLVMTLLVVSCSPESKTLDDGLALLSFSTDKGETRSLTKTDPKLNPDDFYWYYEATKTDGTGLVTGVTDGPTAVDSSSKGLGTTVGPFSYGEWNFTLYAYAGENRPTISGKKAPDTNLAYTGSTSKVISEASGELTVVVASKQTDEVQGTLLFPLKTAMIEDTVTGANVTGTIDYSKFLEEITVTRVDGKDSFKVGEETISKGEGDSNPHKEFYNYAAVDTSDNSKRTLSLESGSYKITFKYIQSATTTSASNTVTGYTGGYTVAEETIYVAIADYLTTEIGGEIASNTGSVKIKVDNGVTSVVISQTVSADKATVFKSSSSAEGEDSSLVETTVPEGSLESGKTAVLTSNVYSPEVASSDNSAKYLFINESDTGSGATESVIMGGVNNILTVENEEKKTFGFEETTDGSSGTKTAKRTVQKITLAKGMNNNSYYLKTSYSGATLANDKVSTQTCDVKSKYSGDTSSYTTANGYSIPDGEVVYYNPETGETHFEMEHFSTYYFASPSAVFYDKKENKVYSDLASALKGVSDGGTITLLKDIELSTSVSFDKTVTVDLNGKTITINSFRGATDVFGLKNSSSTSYTVTFQNGTINTKDTSNTNINILFYVGNKAGLNLSKVTTNTYACCGIYCMIKSNPATVNVDNCALEGFYCYGIGTNATDAENTYVNLTITNSKIATSSASYDNTGLLVNVPAKVIIKNSEISGDRQGVILRGTGADLVSIVNSKISVTGKGTEKTTENNTGYTDRTTTWSSGNEVALAALVIGNSKSTVGSYKRGTTVNLEDVDITLCQDYKGKSIWVTQASADYPVTVTGDIKPEWTVNTDMNGASYPCATINDGSTYYTLEEAVAAATSNQTIKLFRDLDLTGNYAKSAAHPFVFKENVTVDLNEKTITTNNYGVYWEGNGLTIKNGTFKGLDAEKTAENKNKGKASYALFIGLNNHEGNRKDSSYTATVENITCEGGINVCSHNLVVKNTTVTGTHFYAFWAENGAVITVKSGTFSGGAASVLRTGTISNGCPVGQIVIEGGTFNLGDATRIFFDATTEENKFVVVKGGTFNSDPSNYLASGYKAEKDSGGNTWTVSEVEGQ